jgi:mannose-6-phosphate isomerase-like protein (cupin superfamily)
MSHSKIFSHLDEIEAVVNAHGVGAKRAFLNNEDTPTKLTQFAYSKLQPGEICGLHTHVTMEEYFFFLSGTAKYFVGEEVYNVEKGSFLRIPANTYHELRNNNTEELEIIYFGIATD